MRAAPLLFVVATAFFSMTSATVRAGREQQSPAAVDFVRDVQPILRENCVGCHGPTQQMNGFRLDRRRDAMRGGTFAVIGPGNSAGSRLYQRLIGSEFGIQMPPTGALPKEKVAIIKAWIDQGAQWPDAASGDVAAVPIDPAATQIVQLLRTGDFAGARMRLAQNATLVNARGPGGATPFMFATLYADLATFTDPLGRGADVNAHDDEGATPLMWAIADAAKARVLIERGADVNARSTHGRTALMIAAGQTGTAPIVKLLLDQGAKVDAVSSSLFGTTTALTDAAYSGNEGAFKLLVAAGADLKKAGPPALGLSFRSGCMTCADMLMKAFPAELMTATMMASAPPTGPALATPMFLARGATLDARDPSGRSMLMLAAASDAMPVDAVKALLAKTVDVNERTAAGQTAIGLARRHGDTAIVRLLLDAGAKDEAMTPAPAPSPASSARAAIERALPLLQQSDATFLKKSGCVSCHNNSLTAFTVSAARQKNVRVDAAIAGDQQRRIGAYLEGWRDRTLQGVGIPGDADTISYILNGLAAEGYAGDLQTDAQAFFLKRAQFADGHWSTFANRPPIESSAIEVTASSVRAMQVYAPPARRAEFDAAIAAGAAWLRTATPRVNEDRAFQLLGLHWTNAATSAIDAAGRALLQEQRNDGGWAQLATLESDAYATGQALYALVESGAVATNDPAYRRGVDFLLKRQLADGSWFVRTRAIPIQPLFDAGFPHGPDAFISAASTNWATLALTAGVSGR
ncbi:MAG: ankyrin repeat domain-containing protein [Acidobacteriota bacterium]